MSKSAVRKIAKHKTRKAAGRTPSAKSESTRRQILDTAASIFAERGYSLTRLSDIANGVGIHLTALYYYYDNKEELVSDLISSVPEHSYKSLLEAIDALPANCSVRTRIETLITVYLRSILRQDDYVRSLHRVGMQISQQGQEQFLKVSRRINDIWKRELEAAVRSGAIRSDLDLKMLRMLLIGAMNWSVEWFDRKGGPPDRLADVLKVMLFDGVAAPSR